MAINTTIFDSRITELRTEYSDNVPYPHISIDSFLESESFEKIAADFPEVNDQFWTHYIHYNEKKHGLTKWEHIPNSIQGLIKELREPQFIKWLESLTGISNLFADEELEGGGLHQTKRDGFLNIHADFTVHPKHRNWQRRVNVLLYLNNSWDSDWGGNLELWNNTMTKCEKSVPPLANRVVIFSTGPETYHGYPSPIKCPENVSRKSIALYYYTEEETPQKSSTLYRARPNDGSKKWLIWGDTLLLSLYSKIKGSLGLNDDFVSSILNFFNKKI